MPDLEPGKRTPKISTSRIVVWIVTAAVGLWLIGTGVAGIIAKGG